MVEYYQFIAEPFTREEYDEVFQHVVQHLASVVATDDEYAGTEGFSIALRVEDEVRQSDGRPGKAIYGRVDAEPNAPYLRPDFNPEDDAQSNPLSVPSILDEGVEVKNVRSENT
jgi:hypothetical protein